MPEPIEVTPFEMLRLLIASKCDWKRPDPNDIAAWLLSEKPGLLRMALDQLIEEAAQQRADDEGAQDMLEIRAVATRGRRRDARSSRDAGRSTPLPVLAHDRADGACVPASGRDIQTSRG